ncbi:hypothetical protein KY343_02175 [Candidatus Woesearchaeota archaeon]|nr:hypothetical protein [Candidatus Woesearchaeota archaeon]
METIEQICGNRHSWFYQITDRFGLTRPTSRVIRALNHRIAEERRNLKKTEDRSSRLDIEDRIAQYKVQALDLQVQDDLVSAAQSVLGKEFNTLEKVCGYINPKIRVVEITETQTPSGTTAGTIISVAEKESQAYRQRKRTVLRKMQHCFEKKYGDMDKKVEKEIRYEKIASDKYSEAIMNINQYGRELDKVEKEIEEVSARRSRIQKELKSVVEKEKTLENSGKSTGDIELYKELFSNYLRELKDSLTSCNIDLEEKSFKRREYKRIFIDNEECADSMNSIIDGIQRRIDHYYKWSRFYEKIKGAADELDKEFAAAKAA